MITDLIQIKRLGEQKLKENMAFRVFMKSHNVPELRLRRIAENVEEQIDCRACANCCRVAETPITERDVERLAKFLGIPTAEFTGKYARWSDEDRSMVLKMNERGCVFLEGNDCTVYEARPANCQDFPHLVRGSGSIAARMWQFIDRAKYCPIVYNAMEEYKTALRFYERTGRRRRFS